MLHDFTQNISRLSAESGFNSADLAAVLNKKEYTIIGWRMGWFTPGLEDLFLLAKLFGVSVSDLVKKPINEQQNDFNLLTFSPFTKN